MTDVLKLSPAYAGALFFIARIWDAVNDPAIGMIVDNTHTKWGKFRPWLLIGTIINAVVFVLLFTSRGMSTSQLYVYIGVMYILYGMTYTIMDVPYWSWLPNLTSDPREREEVSVIPRFFASMAGFIVGTFGLFIITNLDKIFGNGDLKAGYTAFAVVIAVIFLVTIGITVFNVPEAPKNKSAEKTNLKQAFKLLIKNDQMIAFMGVLLAFNLCTQIVNGILIYYFKYVTGMESLFSVFNFCILAEMLGLMLFPKVAKRLERPKVYTLACSLVVLGLVIILIGGFVAPHNVLIVVLGAATLKIGSAFSLGITTVSIADVIDYGELKFGTRNESIICSAQTFLMKASQAVSGLFTGVGLAIVGYVPDVQQTATAIFGIRVLMIAIPAIFVALSYFIYKKHYKLKGNYLKEIAEKAELKVAE
ncbi:MULTISPECIES: melibiose:sodium transporter MelB [Clostridium]|uniref:melibiose:sodium transporter MelB n=1 Tax=Clostridium TaxID=1485 RepID=UPI001F59320D|nr:MULTISPECIES: melibiose:sodium transporter MelB [Clostridium]MDI9210230.1 melibiose:sodium transporter MelB [Clostridium butyricum]MDU1116979.1 melibiose:sodium transporter MelB [Clostridium sp.]MDU4587752.1 melibiose:sodium transporter MelB [Clostridium sp.]MDU7713224.1 melibiose:sodium transporter MelB [Clostridium butyricum]